MPAASHQRIIQPHLTDFLFNFLIQLEVLIGGRDRFQVVALADLLSFWRLFYFVLVFGQDLIDQHVGILAGHARKRSGVGGFGGSIARFISRSIQQPACGGY